MSLQNGGKRPGAGRPRTREKHGGEIAAAEQRIADRLPLLIDKAFELAEGVKVQRKTPSGEYVYSSPPCIKSIAYLIDRIAGKPTQAMEIGDPDGNAIKNTVTIYLPDNERNPVGEIDPSTGRSPRNLA